MADRMKLYDEPIARCPYFKKPSERTETLNELKVFPFIILDLSNLKQFVRMPLTTLLETRLI